jgi:hypothetical protein
MNETIDCSAESPKGRRNVCYDREGQQARKASKPEDNAIDMAAKLRENTFLTPSKTRKKEN